MLKETVVLTGATGFIGSHLLQALVDSGRDVAILCHSFSDTRHIGHLLGRVRRIDLDIQDLAQALSMTRLLGVIHVAADYGRMGNDAEGVFKANFLLPVRILDAAIRNKARFFINTESFFNKPQFQYPYLQEYTYSKKCFLGWALKKSRELHVANVQLEHVYGPQDGPEKFVSSVLAQMLDPDSVEIKLTPGEQKRDFVFISDVVDAYMRVIVSAERSGPGYCCFEVGTGASTEVKHFVQMIHAAAKSTTKLSFGAIPYRESEIMDSFADLTAIRSLGYTPNVSLQEGIRRLVDATLQERQKLMN